MSSLTEDILSNIDIVDIASRYVDLKKSGSNFSGYSPFRNERTPSFIVSPDKQIFKCFSTGTGGNAFTLVMEVEKVDFSEAVKILSKEANIDVSKYKDSFKENTNIKSEKEKIKLINKYALKFFQDKFEENEQAKQYIYEKRGLDKNCVEKFGIGYAPDNYYEIINFLKEKGFNDNDLISSGIAKKGSSGDLYSFFRNRVMFSIYDHIGNIVAFAGRGLDEDTTPKYLNSPDTKLYDKSKVLYGLNISKQYVKDFDKLILVEGYMDVLAMYKADFPVGIASCGTALSGQHIKLIKRNTKNLVFSFDTDDAGFDASIRGLKISYDQDLFPQILILSKGYKDIDEYIFGKYGNIEDEISYIDGFDFVLDNFQKRYDIDKPTDRKEALSKIFDILYYIKDFSILTLYVEKVANIFNTNYELIFQQFKKYKNDTKKYSYSYDEQSDNYKSNDDKYILASIFYSDFLSKNNIELEEFEDLKSVLIDISNYFEDSLLKKLFDDKLEQEDINKILECQLWWEQQFEQSNTDKEDVLKKFLQRQIHILSKIILKSKTIPNDEKNNLITKLKQVFVKK